MMFPENNGQGSLTSNWNATCHLRQITWLYLTGRGRFLWFQIYLSLVSAWISTTTTNTTMSPTMHMIGNTVVSLCYSHGMRSSTCVNKPTRRDHVQKFGREMENSRNHFFGIRGVPENFGQVALSMSPYSDWLAGFVEFELQFLFYWGRSVTSYRGLDLNSCFPMVSSLQG